MMKKILMLGAALTVAGVSAFGSPCAAPTTLFNTTVSPGVTYTDTGFSCTDGGYTFSNFQVFTNSPNDTGSFFLQISGVNSGGVTGLTFGTNVVAGQDYQLE